MAIRISERELTKRNQSIRQLFLDVCKDVNVTDKRQNHQVNYVVKDRSSTTTGEIFFGTSNQNVKASYQEIWINSTGNDWTLSKSKLKVVHKENYNEFKEILSLHMDLDEIQNEYKKMSHLHIKHPKNESISNAHIGLNINDYHLVSNGIKDFDNNLKKQIKMINSEFILAFKPA